jgi:hypothetical protein
MGLFKKKKNMKSFSKRPYYYYITILILLISLFYFKNPYIYKRYDYLYAIFPNMKGNTYDYSVLNQISFIIGCIIIISVIIIEYFVKNRKILKNESQIIKEKNEKRCSEKETSLKPEVTTKKEPNLSNTEICLKQKIKSKIGLWIGKEPNELRNIDYFIELVYFLFIIFFVIYYFYRNNIFELEHLSDNDYPYHYNYIWWFSEIGYEEFGSINGYFSQYYAGIPYNNIFTPGLSILYFIISRIIPISILDFMKLLIVILMVFFIVIPRIIGIKLGLKRIYTIIASFYILTNGDLFVRIKHGNFPYLVSIMFFLIFVLIMEKMLDSGKYENFKIYMKNPLTYLLILILATMVLVHFLSAIMVAIYCASKILREISKHHFQKKSKELIKFMVVIGVGGIIITFFWLITIINVLMLNLNQQSNNYMSQLFSEDYVIFKFNPLLQYLKSENPGDLFMAISGLSLMLKSKKSFERDFGYFCLSIMIFLGFVSFDNTSMLINTLTPFRFLFLILLFRGVFIATFLNKIAKYVKKFQLQKRIKKNANENEATIHNKKIVLLNVSFFTLIFINSMAAVVWREEITMQQGLDEDVEDIFNWISTTYEKNYTQSRILMEDSSYLTQLQWSGGYNQAYLSTYTNTPIIGGYQGGTWMKWTVHSSCIDGQAFNVSFNEMTLDYFIQNLDLYNINVFILWSNQSNSFVQKTPSLFVPIKSYGKFSIYNYTNASNSFISLDGNYQQNEGKTWNIIDFSDSKISIQFTNITKGDYFNFSLYNYFNWHIYENDKIGNFNKEFDIMSYTFKDNGNISIDIIWEKNTSDRLSEGLSAFGFIACIIGIVYQTYRNWKTKKNK